MTKSVFKLETVFKTDCKISKELLNNNFSVFNAFIDVPVNEIPCSEGKLFILFTLCQVCGIYSNCFYVIIFCCIFVLIFVLHSFRTLIRLYTYFLFAKMYFNQNSQIKSPF